MMIKTAACLLALGFLSACQSTMTTTKRETLREQNARYANSTSDSEPAPPAEGPATLTPDGHIDPDLVASPLFQQSAAGGL